MMQLATRASLVFLVLLITSASWAAGGWYLLIPPEGEYDERAEFPNGYKILDSAPLSQWSLQGGYESASECETSRSRYLIIEQAALLEVRGGVPQGDRRGNRAGRA